MGWAADSPPPSTVHPADSLRSQLMHRLGGYVDQALILDRYRPLADLGSGGHASVTLAYDTKMGRRVAIKRLPLPLDSLGRPQRVGLAEARTAALLAHPAIVTVFEWDTDADEAFIIMEAVEGASLAEVLDRLGRLDLDETAAVLAPVAEALAFAHENGVLHLDVKPENVLVMRTGAVKVADFGIASLTGLSGTASVEAGTVGFMAPEQLRGEPVDARTDEWALASLAFELITGANPFVAPTQAEALTRAETASFHGPSELLRGIPVAVDDVLFAALAPEPAERYPGIEAFGDALLPHLGDPDAGRRTLAATVQELTADDVEEDEEALEGLGAWDRLAYWSPWLTRAGAAVVCTWLTYLGLQPWRFGLVATAAGSGLVALAAAFAPALGLALALGTLVFGGLHVSALTGVLLAAFGLALWLTLGRRGRGSSLLPPAAPVLAALHAGPLAPLLLGFTFEPLEAALAGGFSALAVMAASALGGHGAPLLAVDAGTLVDPWSALEVAGRFGTFATVGPYVVVVAWAGGAAVASWFAQRGTRGAAAAGSVLALVAMLAGYGAWWLALGRGFSPATVALQQLTVSLILMGVVIALGPPVRGEGDDDIADEEPG